MAKNITAKPKLVRILKNSRSKTLRGRDNDQKMVKNCHNMDETYKIMINGKNGYCSQTLSKIGQKWSNVFRKKLKWVKIGFTKQRWLSEN